MTPVQRDTLVRAVKNKNGRVWPSDWPREKAVAGNTIQCLARDGFIVRDANFQWVVSIKGRKALGL